MKATLPESAATQEETRNIQSHNIPKELLDSNDSIGKNTASSNDNDKQINIQAEDNTPTEVKPRITLDSENSVSGGAS